MGLRAKLYSDVPTIEVTLDENLDSIGAANLAAFLYDQFFSIDDPFSVKSCILDMSSVEKITSAGFGVLISILQEATLRKGKLVMYGGSDTIQKMFELLQLNHVFPFVADESEAMEKIKEV